MTENEGSRITLAVLRAYRRDWRWWAPFVSDGWRDLAYMDAQHQVDLYCRHMRLFKDLRENALKYRVGAHGNTALRRVTDGL